MKSIQITDVAHLKNELNKYKQGKKLDIRQFNQAARLAWLGKVVMAPLDPADPDTRSYLAYFDHPDPFTANFVNIDEDLVGHIFVLDAEQSDAIAHVLEQGVRDRAALFEELNRRDFYFDRFYRPSQPDKDKS